MEDNKKLNVSSVDPAEIVRLKKELHELAFTKEKMIRTLEDKPFLKLPVRKKLKDAIPQYETKMQKLRSRITVLEMCAGLSQECLENTVIRKHFQDRK